MEISQDPAERIPEDVILYGTLCEDLLGFWIAYLLGHDDDSRMFIEEHLVSRAPRDRKLEMLRLLLADRLPEIMKEPPYATLFKRETGTLARLFDFRDRVAHSQPLHGQRFERVRRVKARNVPFIIDDDEMAAAWARGILCHSALTGIGVHLGHQILDVTAEATTDTTLAD